MEYVIISGGAAADMSKGVRVIDLDNLEDSTSTPDDFAEAYNELIGTEFGWAERVIESYWKDRDDTHVCARCGQYVADEGGVLVDITGGDVCADLEGVEGAHTF